MPGRWPMIGNAHAFYVCRPLSASASTCMLVCALQAKIAAYGFQLHGSNQPEHCHFHGLLLSCRAVYTEASVLLYRTNRFIIRYCDIGSLEPLRNLTPLALSNLTHLKVILNEASCHSEVSWNRDAVRKIDNDHHLTSLGVDGIEPNPRLGLPGHGKVISASEEAVKQLLADWESMVDHLSSRISPGVLDLSVVCDVLYEDIDTAKRVVAPLARLPLLKDCHLRLSNLRTPELSSLAQDAARKACGLSYPQVSEPGSYSHVTSSAPLLGSRLMELPPELRLYVLEYTDLVTPWKEVTWRRQGRVFLASRARCAKLKPGGEEREVHHGCQFVDCWHAYPEPSIGCFCRVKHSAFSSHCKCWESPLPLLLVCRALYKEAQSVLFSQNRYVIHDYDCRCPKEAPSRCIGSSAASVFLDEAVPKDCLGHLRFLEFVYPPYNHDAWPLAEDWKETIDRVKGDLNLPALTVRLVMAKSDYFSLLRHVSKEQGEEILAGYNRILEPLVQLGGEGGLAGSYADFDWPWSQDWETLERVLQLGDGFLWLDDKLLELNERAERLVLGDERYERQVRRGIRTRGFMDSLWVRNFAFV